MREDQRKGDQGGRCRRVVLLLSLAVLGCEIDTSDPVGEPLQRADGSTPWGLPVATGSIESVRYGMRVGGSLLTPQGLSAAEIALTASYHDDGTGGERMILELDDPSFPANWDQPSVDVGRVELADGAVRVWGRRGFLKPEWTGLSADDPVLELARTRSLPPAPWDNVSNNDTDGGLTPDELARGRSQRLLPDPDDASEVLARLRAASESERELPSGIVEFVSSRGGLRVTSTFDPRIGAITSSVTEEAGRTRGTMEYRYSMDAQDRPRLESIRAEAFDESGNRLSVREMTVESFTAANGGA